MTNFLSFVALVSGLVGLVFLMIGPAFVGPIWWLIAMVCAIGVGVLNLLRRIAVAAEAAAGQTNSASKILPPTP